MQTASARAHGSLLSRAVEAAGERAVIEPFKTARGSGIGMDGGPRAKIDGGVDDEAHAGGRVEG